MSAVVSALRGRGFDHGANQFLTPSHLTMLSAEASDRGLKSKGDLYRRALRDFIESVRAHSWGATVSDERLEYQFEGLADWSLFRSKAEVERWFDERRTQCPMQTEVIGLKEVRAWQADPTTGNLAHESGDFFVVHGVRCTIRRADGTEKEWDQPFLTQVGYDGGRKGLLRKRFEGIPHYLIEAKIEAGNYAKVQLSPTAQAAFSNPGLAPRGKNPPLAELFEDPKKYGAKVLYQAWLAEDGGRFYLKRNLGMLIELPEAIPVEVPDDFLWMSLYQIKDCLWQNAWVSPHLRGLVAHL